MRDDEQPLGAIGNKDFNHKSPAEIIQHLCACRKVGANYLLNVGPTPAGAIPAYEAAVLRKVGAWIAQVGDAIYEGKPCTVRCQGARLCPARRQEILLFRARPYRAREMRTSVGPGGGGNGPAFRGRLAFADPSRALARQTMPPGNLSSRRIKHCLP